MGNCLNVLDTPEVFILVATLLVLVLLVWAQLSKPKENKDLDKDFNLVCGFAWTYLAIFFALIAVALFICEINTCANGFLVLSFLMTIVNVLIAVVTIPMKVILNIISNRRPSESLTKLDKWWEKTIWLIIFWIFLLVGSGFISFTLVNKLGCLYSPCFCTGVALVTVAVLFAVISMCCAIFRHKNCTNRP